ncbi:hypothetical protein FQN57_001973 [Myotisia sp. PD_48]|nr:hypothetical protein FQN57_001973 [Myotisia sp. PD_48]
MAQNTLGRTLFPVCSSAGCLAIQRRTFSSTVSKLKPPLPVFKPTASPELDGLLERFRNTLFIPRWLPLKHRKLITKQSQATKLQENPITLKIGGKSDQSFTLKPIRLDQLPTKAETERVVELMKTPEDWQNLIPFLAGMQFSGRKLSLRQWEAIIRKAGLNGGEEAIYKAAVENHVTALSLKFPSLTLHLLRAIRRKAADADFKGQPVDDAVRQVEAVARLLNSEAHTNSDLASDPKRLPEVIGAMLEIHAAKALNSYGGQDKDGKVRDFAQKLVSTWPLANLTVPEHWAAANFQLFFAIPLWNGIKSALQVHEIREDPELKKKLVTRMAELSKSIEQLMTKVEEAGKEQTPAGLKEAQRYYQKSETQ